MALKRKTLFLILPFVIMALLVPALSLSAHAASCPNCGSTMIADVMTPASCIDPGLTEYKCPQCNYSYFDEIKAKGHTYQVTYHATCTTGGTAVYTCIYGDESHEETVGPLGHDYARTETEPTCVEDGSQVDTCRRCGHRVTTVLPAVGHSPEREMSYPSCDDEGIVAMTCRVCGEELLREVMPPRGHRYEVVEIPADCTEPGLRMRTCGICGEEEEPEILPAAGHDYQPVELVPACDEDGVTAMVCTHCGDEESRTVLPAAGHKYETVELAPTCTEDGRRTATCVRCGAVTVEALPAEGHRFGEWEDVKASTLLEEGLKERVCAECGFTEQRSIPKKNAALVGGTAAAAVLALGLGLAYGFKKTAVGAAAAAAESVAAAEGMAAVESAAAEGFEAGLVSIPMKWVLLYLSDNERNEAFAKMLKKRLYLNVKIVPYGDFEALKKQAKEEKPDLVILSTDAADALRSSAEELKEACKDVSIAVIDETGNNTIALQAMKDAGLLFAFASAEWGGERRLAKLVLPLYYPGSSSGSWAANAGMITDALGLPVISILLKTYVVGDDVVYAVKNKGLSVADTAELVSDVAYLLGLDTLSDIGELLRVGADQTERIIDRKKEAAQAKEPAEEKTPKTEGAAKTEGSAETEQA